MNALAKIYKLYFSSDRQYIRALKNLLGYTPENLSLYYMAFRHKSAARTLTNGSKNSNERLEFLGDAILGSVVAGMLFKMYPYRDEGFLTEMRAKIVNRSNLNQLAKKLGLNELIQYDHKVVAQGGKLDSLLGDAFEALVGAIYLDKGYVFTNNVLVSRILKLHVDIHTLESTETNFKSKLIEWCQRHSKEITFELTANESGDSPKLFTITVNIDGDPYGIGRDYNKKNAEKLAAEKAYSALNI